MLMAVKVKDINIFPVIQILSKPVEEEQETKFFRRPELFYYHLKLLLESGRMGKNILQEFIDRDLTPDGITWLAGELLKRDRQFSKELDYVFDRGNSQDPGAGRL